MAFLMFILLIIGSFIAYALWSAGKRVARGGPLGHPGHTRGTTITGFTGSTVTLSDGCVYLVSPTDISTWRVGQQATFVSGVLMNGSERVPCTFLHKSGAAK